MVEPSMESHEQSAQVWSPTPQERLRGSMGESQPLVNARSGGSFARQSLDHEPEPVPTTTVEMFSDLVVAAAISALSIPLEESTPDMIDWLWFWLRVYFVLALWHTCLLLNDIVDLYGADVQSVEFGILVHVFGTVFLIVGVVLSSLRGNNAVTAVIYILARMSVLVLGRLESDTKPRRSFTGQSRYDNFVSAMRLMNFFIPLECTPLVVALVVYRDTEYGILIGGYLSVAIVAVWRRIFARQIDFSPSYVHEEHHAMDLSHVRERYEVVVLVFFGSLCFVDSSTGLYGYYVSMCSVVTAMAAFLMYFVARVRGRTEPWLVSAEGGIRYPHIHIVLFIVISSMAVTFSQVVRDSQEKVDWSIDPGTLMCAYSGAFLAALGFMDFLSEDPIVEHRRPRVSQVYRVVIYFVAGMALAVCGRFPIKQNSETLIPIVFTVVATIQVWAVRRD